VLLGDLALLHDLNALALLRGRPVTVVVVNNGGGGIFHFLPIAEHADVFEPHFTTPHDVSFEKTAAMFGLAYDRPATPGAFAETYRARSRNGAPALIEVQTDREENRALHEDLEARIARAVEADMES
jgi:2-succinyl-5-enolpyruvyl-6-hydroxy-3-cyclohexene-1-carboxylate synthase